MVVANDAAQQSSSPSRSRDPVSSTTRSFAAATVGDGPRVDHARRRELAAAKARSRRAPRGSKPSNTSTNQLEQQQQQQQQQQQKRQRQRTGPKDWHIDITEADIVGNIVHRFRGEWIACECLATTHGLFTNCIGCGKILCTVEVQLNAIRDRDRFLEIDGIENLANNDVVQHAAARAVFCSFCGDPVVAILADGTSSEPPTTILSNTLVSNNDSQLEKHSVVTSASGFAPQNLREAQQSSKRKNQRGENVVVFSTGGGASSGVNLLYPDAGRRTKRAPALIPREGPLFAAKTEPDILDKFKMEEEGHASDDTLGASDREGSLSRPGSTIGTATQVTNLPDRSNITDPALRAATEQRDRLLHYQDTSEQRTRVHDLASDFDYHSEMANKWLTREQRAKAAKLQEELDSQIDAHNNRASKPIALTLDFGSGTVAADTEPQRGAIFKPDKKTVQ